MKMIYYGQAIIHEEGVDMNISFLVELFKHNSHAALDIPFIHIVSGIKAIESHTTQFVPTKAI